MSNATRRSIVLIGFMGTGKSAVGRALARRLQMIWLDTDTEIEREAGKSIPQIFAEEGEAAFRARETAVLSALSPPHGDRVRRNFVLSTGGGTPLRAENAALLTQLGTIVWLQTSAEAIVARIGPDFRTRPLLADFQENPQERIQSLLAVRAPHYAALADFALDTSDCAGPEEAAEILALLASC